MFSPRTADEVAEFFRRRNDRVHISGASSESTEVETLSLSHLHSVLLYEPEEMIISVEAGITLLQLSTILSERGQWIPTLVANENNTYTLGGSIAEDQYQPRAKTLGMLRTTILGGTFCTTDGVLFKSGSRVVKSVAGYDIHRAFCGSRGFFGAIIALTLKVQPLPEVFFRFTASINLKDAIYQYNPTVIEAFEGELLVEIAGFREDIHQEKETLLSLIPPIKEISDTQWESRIKKIQIAKQQISISTEAELLLSKVKAVFDPKHILV